MSRNFKTAIFTTLATVFVALSTPVNALNNGDLYEACKPFVDSAFTVNNANSFLCTAYFRGTGDAGHRLCKTLTEIITDGVADSSMSIEAAASTLAIRSIDGLGVIGGGEMKAALQHYVNEMSKTPEKWKYNASLAVHESLKKMAPCE